MQISRICRSIFAASLLALSYLQQAFGANGGSYCDQVFCVGATVTGGNTYYSLNTTVPFRKLGWMAVGFGTEMGGSPMVILWPNDDGTITLTQRESSGEKPPQVVSNPARVATVQTSLSTLTGSAVTLSFSAPSSGQSTENMIYGLSLHRPGSSAASAMDVHNFKGTFQLDLTRTVADLPTSVTSGNGSAATSALPVPTGTTGSSASIPYSSYEIKLIVHAVLASVGFCFFLPLGVLQARFFRIWWSMWFKAHWIIQAGVAGACIIIGVGMGVISVHESGGDHFSDKHMVIGLILFVLYALQALYGYIIHRVKSPNRTKRPIQNYGHAVVGLFVIGLSLYQVWIGFDDEWSDATGRDQPGRGVYAFWIVWSAILGGAYVLGLALLPKQYKSEAEAVKNRQKPSLPESSYDDFFPLTERQG